MPSDATTPYVVAVLVAADEAPLLSGVLAAVAGQTRPPDELRRQPRNPAGFGAAVAAALAEREVPPGAYVWLLHDDAVPDPTALAILLDTLTADPAIGIAGPKLRSLDGHRLLEVGLTVSRGGRRETGLDRDELDQGQHDGTRDVLAVNTAGLLIRHDLWRRLGGLDPRLPLVLDDVDLGWRARLAGARVVCVTDAVLRHPPSGAGRRRSARRHGAYLLLANLPLPAALVAAVRLLVGGLLRALGLLLVGAPRAAVDELAALVAVYGRPWRLVAARWSRRRVRTVPPRRVLPLLAPRGLAWRRWAEAVTSRLGPAPRGPQPGGPVTETGPVPAEAEELPSWGAGLGRRLVRQPVLWLGVALTMLDLVAVRRLLGGGRLLGGALLPAPDSASQLWREYVAAWHPVGLGSALQAPPSLAALAAPAYLLGGPDRAVSLLLLGAVPLAGLSGYAVVRHLVASPRLRLWAATAYALLPATLGAVSTGRLGTAVVAVLLPPAGLALARAAAGTRAAATATLLVAVTGAFVPLAVPVAAVVALGAALTVRGVARLRLGLVVVGPALLLGPWWPRFVAEPGLVWQESGLPGPGLSEQRLGALDLLGLAPGGPGQPPLVLTAGLLAAALAGLLRPDRRRPVLLGWGLALAALALAAVQARVTVGGPALESPVRAWPGPALLLAGAGLLTAAVVGAEGATARLARRSFGWAQPVAAAVAVLAALGPVLAGAWWGWQGVRGPVDRRDPVLLPAFVAAEGASPERPRTLALRARPDGSIGYALLRGTGPRLGDAELTPPPGRAGKRLAALVADLTSGRGGDVAARLLPYGVRFVLLAHPAPRPLAQAVEAVPGVVRVAGPRGAVLWRLSYPSGRVRLLPPGAGVVGPDGAPPPARVVPAGQTGARAQLPPGPDGRLLVLADPASSRWRARLDGRPLRPLRYAGWAQAFEVPAAGGELHLRFTEPTRPWLAGAQLAGLLVLVLIALPPARAGDPR